MFGNYFKETTRKFRQNIWGNSKKCNENSRKRSRSEEKIGSAAVSGNVKAVFCGNKVLMKFYQTDEQLKLRKSF